MHILRQSKARLIIDPTATDSSRRVGAIVVPSGTATPGGIPTGSATVKYGLVATDGSDSNFNLTKLPDLGAGVYANGYNYGVYSDGYYGVYGKSSGGYGLEVSIRQLDNLFFTHALTLPA